MKKITHVVDEQQVGDRIDKMLPTIDEEWSRSQVQQWIKSGHVLVNEAKIKANYLVALGDEIEIYIPEPEELDVVAEKMDLNIFYEDKDVLVVEKPRGMVVHPAPGHPTGTLVNGILGYCTDLSGINGVLRPGIVHRLDKDTSGLLVVAKNDLAHERLVNQLVDRTVTRKYIALVHGIIPHDHGTIEAPIGRDKMDRQSMTIVDDGREAITHFEVLERFDEYTLVECQLETGRTHQIRVHMKYIGYPIAGDQKYGLRKTLDIGGQALHASILGFNHPRTEEYLEFKAELPAYFKKIIAEFTKKD